MLIDSAAQYASVKEYLESAGFVGLPDSASIAWSQPDPLKLNLSYIRKEMIVNTVSGPVQPNTP